MTQVPDSPTPEAAVRRLAETSEDVRAVLMLDEAGELEAHHGTDAAGADRLRELSVELLRAARAAGARSGIEAVARLEISRPDGGVFAVHERPPGGRGRTLVTITSGGALPSLVLYDMRMTLAGHGAGP